MALPGPTPSDDSTRSAEWVEVEDIPFPGPYPISMPSTRGILVAGMPKRVDWQHETRVWFDIACALPHAVLWGPGDWSLVESSLTVADNSFLGITSASAELRRREDALGFTIEARRKLRIRYLPPGGNTANAKAAAAAKTAEDKKAALDKRRTDRRARALSKGRPGATPTK